MPEEFLQYIWENQLFFKNEIQTIDCQQIEILDVGQRNSNSGPDFFNAKIKIEETVWAGNIEIHKKASDWENHQHYDDKMYDNVILHVVEIADKTIVRSNGTQIATCELKYPLKYKLNYQNLLASKKWIACQPYFHKIDPYSFKLGYHRLMIERLENKTQAILDSLQENQNNWNETFYILLAKMFGFKVNALPFEMLAKSISLQTISKQKTNLFQIEALLFGNAGLLNTQLLGDNYFLELRNEYSFFRKKYQLKGIESYLWKFMRMRPGNFPTIRISQFAALIHQSSALFSKIIEIEHMDSLKKLFQVAASSYWDSHYVFNKPSKTKKKKLGENSINSLLINTVVPFLFIYGETQNKTYLKDRALDFLEELPPEKNSIVKKWETLGVKARSAYESQALLQLKNMYCDRKKCLNCQIGNKIIKETEDLVNGATNK